jgi:hypothetical protein
MVGSFKNVPDFDFVSSFLELLQDNYRKIIKIIGRKSKIIKIQIFRKSVRLTHEANCRSSYKHEILGIFR